MKKQCLTEVRQYVKTLLQTDSVSLIAALQGCAAVTASLAAEEFGAKLVLGFREFVLMLGRRVNLSSLSQGTEFGISSLTSTRQ